MEQIESQLELVQSLINKYHENISGQPLEEESTSEFYTGDHVISSEALYTNPYDIKQILDYCEIRKIQSICDLGSGISPLAITKCALKSPVEVLAVEGLSTRAQLGKKICQDEFEESITYYQQDLASQVLPQTDAYFFYLPYSQTIRKVMTQLLYGPSKYLFVIESHGDFLENLFFDFSDYLEICQKLPLKAKRHDPNLYILKTKNMSQFQGILKQWKSTTHIDREQASLRKLIFLAERSDIELLISEEDKVWIASAQDYLYREADQRIELKNPPRAPLLSQVIGAQRFSGATLRAIMNRNQKTVFPNGEIRKIYISPHLAIEYSDGSIYTVT